MEMVLSASAEQRGAPRGRKPLTRSRCKLETFTSDSGWLRVQIAPPVVSGEGHLRRAQDVCDGPPLELDRVDVDDVPEPVDPEGEDLEERERQHLQALARSGDEDARGRLLSQFGGRL